MTVGDRVIVRVADGAPDIGVADDVGVVVRDRLGVGDAPATVGDG